MRLDRFLCEVHMGSRSQVKEWIKKGMVQADGLTVLKPEYKVDEENTQITFRGRLLSFSKFAYYVLNKPAGMVTSNRDPRSPVVMELLKDVPQKNLFPVGRLDKDAEGLLLITNDGELAHRLLAPKSHVPKTYFLRLKEAFKKGKEKRLSEGVDIGEKKLCLPAETKLISEQEIFITVWEGKFHQVKRMMKAAGNEVLFLKRVAFGSLALDETLASGAYRPLTDEEINQLKKDADYDVGK